MARASTCTVQPGNEQGVTMDDLTELSGPWPAHAPTGELTLTSYWDGDFHIDHADPRVTFSGELIDAIARNPTPQVALTMVNYTIPNGHTGALLKIRDADRQVVYQLTEWLPSIRAYIGEWPE